MSEHTTKDNRAAYTFAEFAKLFGKDRSWTYRLAEKNKIAVIKGYGYALVPASEAKRLSSGLSGKEPNSGLTTLKLIHAGKNVG
ncbi:MAG: hypothetical protein KF712_04105 [Akkermansiaceae bacterium]|nr:hypothetical protein [Akkermansiaceae bacterium]